MTLEIKLESTSQTPSVVDWEPPMPPTDLIFDDVEPHHQIEFGGFWRLSRR
ncbi:hypothetical protein [Scytonema sp. NUACC26]|uniref:hypothetical protein n=1 Tax=Scytonema sp. NUACC26 TaxID=3140176 RepID=UPI0034DC352B